MKKALFLTITVVLSMLVFTACNNERNKDNEKTDENNEVETTEIKKDSAASTVSTASPATTYTIKNLPNGVKEFVSKSYSDYTIVSSSPDPLCGGGPAVDVAITKTGAPNFSLIFKPDGSYVQQEEDVQFSTAPDKIKSTLRTQFGKYNAGGQIEKLILADKSVQYMVDLTNGKNTKEVIFTADGTIFCEN
ncbi:MAG: hypothetical protein ABI123_02180 [Ginsengibacter sp.]